MKRQDSKESASGVSNEEQKTTALQNLAKEAETYQNSKKATKPIEQAYYLQNYNPLKKRTNA